MLCFFCMGDYMKKIIPFESMKQIGAKVPKELHHALKVRAAEEGKSISEIVEALIRKYIHKETP